MGANWRIVRSANPMESGAGPGLPCRDEEGVGFKVAYLSEDEACVGSETVWK